MLKEVRLFKEDLIYPIFIKEGIKSKVEIKSMPGIYQFPLNQVVKEVKEAYDLGVKAVLLFGIPKTKDKKASGAYNPKGIVQQAIQKIKKEIPDLLIITDVCLCEYMSHGHCGIIDKNEEILNDETLALLAKTALSHAKAGADIVAPSDMMDFRVRAIREELDKNGFYQIPIMSYAVKYASSFYGPFRDAAESAPQFGDRKSYQMDYRNKNEALKEAWLDYEEGADFLMVKPAMPYLDIIRDVKEEINLPLVAYQVSGEYSMIIASHELKYLDRKEIILESLTSIKRAGANLIITYFAKEIAKYLK
jgi:porphobilinogen synthase